MKRILSSIFAFLFLMLVCLPVYALGTYHAGRGEVIQINEPLVEKDKGKHAKPQALKIPHIDKYHNMKSGNTHISARVILQREGLCGLEGQISLAGQEVKLSAAGSAFRWKDGRYNTFLASFTGTAGNEAAAVTLSYDYDTRTAYLFASIGALTEESAPIQLTFGEFNQAIETVNLEYIKKMDEQEQGQSGGWDANENIKAYNGGKPIHQLTTYYTMPNSRNAAALSLYCPSEIEEGKNFKFYSKVTTLNSSILNYVTSNIDSSADWARLYSANVDMYSSNSDMLIVTSSPESSSNTVTLYVPYLSGPNPLDVFSYSIFEVRVATSYTEKTIYSQGGYDVKSNHDFYFGGTGAVPPPTDWSGATPNTTKNGIGVFNLMTFVGWGDSSVSMKAKASIVVGYRVDGPRPYSKVVKTMALGSKTASKTISITY